jgi:hypothetical protein
MARRGKLVTKIAAFTVAWLAYGPAVASTFSGELPVGYSDNLFQINGATSFLEIDIFAIGSRDPTICGACYSSYTDNYTVNVFNQAGSLLKSINETNYLYYSLYNDSHGIGAGPVWVSVPSGATKFEVVSRLSIAGLLDSNGLPLTFGDLNIFADGPITAATPLPSTLPLLATGLVILSLVGWRRTRRALA